LGERADRGGGPSKIGGVVTEDSKISDGDKKPGGKTPWCGLGERDVRREKITRKTDRVSQKERAWANSR